MVCAAMSRVEPYGPFQVRLRFGELPEPHVRRADGVPDGSFRHGLLGELSFDGLGRAIQQGADTPEKVVDLVYPDIDPAVRFAAIFSAKAQLDYLSHKNRESGTRADGLDRL